MPVFTKSNGRRRQRRAASRWRTLVAPLVAAAVIASVIGFDHRPASAAPAINSFTATVSDTNLVTLEWDASGAFYNLAWVEEDRVYHGTKIGFVLADCGQPTCTATQRVGRDGVHRYTLRVTGPTGQTAHKTATTAVPEFAPPVVPTTHVDVDYWYPADQTLSWADPGTGRIEVKEGKALAQSPWVDQGPGAGAITVPGSTFAAPGKKTYSLRRCDTIGGTKICSGVVSVVFLTLPGQLDQFRTNVTEGGSTTLNWSSSGNVYEISIPSLGVSEWTSNTSFVVDAATTVGNPGVHNIEVTSCQADGNGFRCSNQGDGVSDLITAPAAGTLVKAAPPSPLWPWPSLSGAPNEVGHIDDGTTLHPIDTDLGGLLEWLVDDGATVQAGDNLALMTQRRSGPGQLIIEPSATASIWTTRDWSADFNGTAYDTSDDLPALAHPLDITFDSDGDIWSLGESSRGVVQIADGVKSGYLVPTPLTDAPGGAIDLEPVVPFQRKNLTRTAVAVGGERVISAGRSVFWVRGDIYSNSLPEDYNQIVQFDLDGSDDAATPYDDRMCVIHVPALADGTYDSDTIGITWDGSRIWFTETQYGRANTSSIGWFAFDGQSHGLSCDSDLDYNDPAAVAVADGLNLCAAPGGADCITRIDTSSPGGGSATHIQPDPTDNSVWFTGGLFRSTLGHYDPDTASLDWYQLPDSNRTEFNNSYPWQLRVTADHVWVGEWNDADIVRFDKSQMGSACEVGAGGPSPCIEEVNLPIVDNAFMHSITLSGDKLWFTLDEAIGYLDITTFDTQPTGVIYNGFESLLGETSRFTGIEVAPNGEVAVNASEARHVVHLTP